MKSRYICMFACLWGLGFLFSCDGFLNENPKDKIPEEDAYKNLTDLYYNAVASLYNNIGGYSDSQGLQGTGRGIYDLNTFTTDEAIMPTRGGDWYDGERLNAWQTVEAYCDAITAMGYRLEDNYEANFAVYNESSVENIFTIPMSKTLYTNQMQYLFRSRHYNHAKAYGLGGENGSSATVEVLRTFGYDTEAVDPRFDKCYFAGIVYDLKGKVVTLDDGTELEYFPWKVDVDISNTPYEKTAGARMKKYAIDETATKDGKLMENDIVLYRYADVLLMKSEAKVRNGENGDEELNLVRSRVNAPFRTATLANLLAERQLEFAWEGWRRQDLIRFRQYTRTYTGRPQLSGEKNGYTTVFPIPEKVRLMNPNLTQNPGY